MSSNCVELNRVPAPPVRTLVYHDMAGRRFQRMALADRRQNARKKRQAGAVWRWNVCRRSLPSACSRNAPTAVEQAEQRLRSEFEQRLQAERAPVAAAVSEFGAQRDQYFARAEAEVVQLALAIAAKILHREAQVDPMLVATLVRMAVEKMREGSSVTIRVGAGEVVAMEGILCSAEQGRACAGGRGCSAQRS